MLTISQISCNVLNINGKSKEEVFSILKKKICSILRCSPSEIMSIDILKMSIDARKKPDIYYSYTLKVDVKNEDIILKRTKSNQVSKYKEKHFLVKNLNNPAGFNPVICGFGPAGIAAAFLLAKKGARPIIIERGSCIDSRKETVNEFWKNGNLCKNSNVQFGEGGAGAFSDGKLNTGNKDKDGIQKQILKTLIEHGAPENILYAAKPHIGTDVLSIVVKNIREHIKSLGGEFLFDTTLDGINTTTTKDKTKIYAIEATTRLGEKININTDCLILAIGHSARDTFLLLKNLGVNLEAKAFAVGYRVAHPQDIIDLSQYGKGYCDKDLPASDYKLTYHTVSGRSVYSFCMCPGGFIVDASSEPNGLAINGMSYSGRNGKYANSAIVMSVSPDELPSFCKDISGEDPLRGMYFQQYIERRAYSVGEGKIPVSKLASNQIIIPEDTFKGRIKQVDGFFKENRILPTPLDEDFLEAMGYYGTKIKGFDSRDTIVAAVESRTSSPIRILRDENYQSKSIEGLFPIGEGAGYAGGIMSAAMDGVKVAAKIINRMV